jgi:hypothetical protein
MKPQKQPQVWHADTLPWQEIGSDGTKYAVLEGQRDLPGEPFTYAFFIPAGFWDAAHWHTADARIAVLSGTFYLGYGDRHADEKLQALRTGGMAFVPAGARHFDGSYEDTILVGTALGPWATYYVDDTANPSSGTF